MTSGDVGADAVNLAGIQKSFGSVHAVKGLDLRIRHGEVVALLGPNGAGKTTLLDMVLGLSEPTSGTISVGGMTPRQAVDAGHVAAVTQTGGLLSDISVGEHVRLIAALFGRGEDRVKEVMAQAGISALDKRKTSACSGGEKQRLKFAMALLPDPDLIVLDEPTTGMDVQARRDFWQDIHKQAMSGRTVVFATHYLEEADEYASRVVMLFDGTVVADGTSAEIRGMLSGRTVTADFPSADEAAKAVELVASLSHDAGVQGSQAMVRTQDSDAVLRAWLAQTEAQNLLVSAQKLEDVFLELTARAASAPQALVPSSTSTSTNAISTGEK